MEPILPLLLLAGAFIVLLLLVLLWQQRRFARWRRDAEQAFQDTQVQYQQELQSFQQNHAQELETLRKLNASLAKEKDKSDKYLNLGKVAQFSQEREPILETLAEAKAQAARIIDAASDAAKQMRAKAQDDVKLIMHKQKEQAHKSLAKLAVQVAKKVTGKSLDYDQHLDIINDAISEL